MPSANRFVFECAACEGRLETDHQNGEWRFVGVETAEGHVNVCANCYLEMCDAVGLEPPRHVVSLVETGRLPPWRRPDGGKS